MAVAVSEPEVVFVVDLVVAEPEVFALVFGAAELSPEVVVLVVEPEVVSVAAELSPGAVVLAAEPGVVFVSPFSIVHVSGRQVSVHIHTAFAVSISVSVGAEAVDIFRRPIFFLFPNIDYYTSLSSFVEDVDKESVGSPTDAHANYDFCRILSIQSLYQNKNLGYIYNKSNPDHNNVSDTSALPTDGTTNPDRKRCLYLYQIQRRHTSQVSLSPLVVRQIRWAAAEEN
ncbi:MAG: hypothetical protein V1753_07065 [Pseudomonadota bacterium]